MDNMTRFLNKVDRSGECWEWRGPIVADNYGQFYLNGRLIGAHRAAYILLVGEIPDGLYILHHCDNPSCVNPDHLFVGTQADNMQDAAIKGRLVPCILTGEDNPNSKLTQSEVGTIRELYATGEFLQRELGEMFSVGATTISAIITEQNWSVT